MVMSKAEKAKRAASAAAKKEEPATAAASVPASPAKKSPPVDMSNALGGKKIEAPAVHEKKVTVGDRVVVVVCKMPRGLYLQHSQGVPMDVRVVGGGIEKRIQPMRVGPQIRLKPAVLPFGAMPNYTIVEGFSFTEVDAEFWNIYYEQNKNFTMITEGLLAAFANEADAKAYCREHGKFKHGLEPLDQKKDPRVEHSTNPNVSDIDIDTDTPRPKA